MKGAPVVKNFEVQWKKMFIHSLADIDITFFTIRGQYSQQTFEYIFNLFRLKW